VRTSIREVQSISAEPLAVCAKEVCPQKRWAKASKRAITSGAGLIFKGSGFYITDYRSDKYKEAAKKIPLPCHSRRQAVRQFRRQTAPANRRAMPNHLRQPRPSFSRLEFGIPRLSSPSLRAAYGALLALMVTSSVRAQLGAPGTFLSRSASGQFLIQSAPSLMPRRLPVSWR